MKGKVCLVTGATSGIGEVTARELARLGATVVLTGRDRQKCERVSAAIREGTGNPRVEFLLADLSLQREVRALAEKFRERHERLDVLVNNAGSVFMRRRESADGLERTFALNHLAYFLLTNLLLDLLRASAPARIIIVASGAHHRASLDFEDLQSRRRYAGFRAYARSKLANLLFTYELARRLEGSGVTANALHPGLVQTGLAGENGPLVRFGWWLASRGGLSPEEGAQTSVYLATSPEVEGVSGRYFVRKQAVVSSPASCDAEAAARLWKVSAELTAVEGRVYQ